MTTNDEWDFYYCRVDDAPASIFLNFAYRTARPSGLDTLYYVGLEILEPDEHGMGADADVKKLWELEDTITNAAGAAGFVFVGRLRNHGDWQLSFYGRAGKEPELEALVVQALSEAERGYRMGCKEDADWSYYEEFLVPDEERMQWIMDRRVVEQLAEAGDVHDISRPVDHFVDLPDAPSLEAFIAAAAEQGFSAVASTSPEEEERHGAHLSRSDPVTLDHIHDVVMSVVELAEQNGGEYNGWGAPIAKRPPH
jgi:hypothetical protein